MPTLEPPRAGPPPEILGDEIIVEPCFGLGCPRRGACRAYHAVEWAAGGATTRATCLRDGVYPRYVNVAGAA